MVLQIAADRDRSIEETTEATEATVELHNSIVRDFGGHEKLLVVPSPELLRFLDGVRDRMAGGFEWHARNPRYRS